MHFGLSLFNPFRMNIKLRIYSDSLWFPRSHKFWGGGTNTFRPWSNAILAGYLHSSFRTLIQSDKESGQLTLQVWKYKEYQTPIRNSVNVIFKHESYNSMTSDLSLIALTNTDFLHGLFDLPLYPICTQNVHGHPPVLNPVSQIVPHCPVSVVRYSALPCPCALPAANLYMPLLGKKKNN